MSDCHAGLQVWRCPRCGHILAEVKMAEGIIRIKCACNQVATLQVAASGAIEQGGVKLDGL